MKQFVSILWPNGWEIFMNTYLTEDNFKTQKLFSDLLINQDYMNKIFGFVL